MEAYPPYPPLPPPPPPYGSGDACFRTRAELAGLLERCDVGAGSNAAGEAGHAAMFACFFTRDHDHGPAVCVACRLPVEQHRRDGDAGPAEDGLQQEGAALTMGTVVAPDAGAAVVPVTAQVVGAAPGAPALRGPCPRTRAELDGHLERCGYGEDAALFAEHFERGAGTGQEEGVRCVECRLPIAQHRLQHRATSADDGAVAGVVVPRVPAPSQTVREGNRFDRTSVESSWPFWAGALGGVVFIALIVFAVLVAPVAMKIAVGVLGMLDTFLLVVCAFQPVKHTVRIAREPAGSSDRELIYDKLLMISALFGGCTGGADARGTRYIVNDVRQVQVDVRTSKNGRTWGTVQLLLNDDVEMPVFESELARLCETAAREWRAYLRPNRPSSLL